MMSDLVRPLNVVTRTSDLGNDRDRSITLAVDQAEVLLRHEPSSPAPITAEHLTLIHLTNGTTTAEVVYRDKTYRGTVADDGILILPPGSECRIRCDRSGENLCLHIVLNAPEIDLGIEPALVGNDATLSDLLLFARTLDSAIMPAASRAQLLERLPSLILNHLLSSFSSNSFLVPCAQRVDGHDCEGAANPYVARAIEYMISHIDQSITLEHIGRAVGRSPGQLGRMFKAQLGRSPYRYLLELRVERARATLATTTTPIAELALDCGFANQEHLTRHFRQFSGTTPAAYRRQMSWQVHSGTAGPKSVHGPSWTSGYDTAMPA